MAPLFQVQFLVALTAGLPLVPLLSLQEGYNRALLTLIYVPHTALLAKKR